MHANWTIFTLMLTAGLSLMACSARNGSRKDLELLTNSPWKYEKAGFDSNDDGIFDALNPAIAGSEKDNMIIFCQDGTGYSALGPSSRFGSRSVRGALDSLPFLWQFQNNDSTIYFQDRYYKVRKLDRQHLEMYADEKFGGVSTRYVIVLRH
ncbi:MAG TPA: hypothetical protein VKU83_01990 [Puia sp.]|nr:hypothetical protein [Puia sp.]